ncbi:hypothetical protein [Coprococcus comes]|nr:hypothetical protein [Coprococcus comes]
MKIRIIESLAMIASLIFVFWKLKKIDKKLIQIKESYNITGKKLIY